MKSSGVTPPLIRVAMATVVVFSLAIALNSCGPESTGSSPGPGDWRVVRADGVETVIEGMNCDLIVRDIAMFLYCRKGSDGPYSIVIEAIEVEKIEAAHE